MWVNNPLWTVIVLLLGSIVNGSFLASHSYLASEYPRAKNEFEMIDPGSIDTDGLKAGDSGGSITNGYEIVRIYPALVDSDYSRVTITFRTGRNTSSPDDWIGVYAPADADITRLAPVKIGFCSDATRYLIDGVGSLTFRVTNFRSNMSVYYFTGGLSAPAAVHRAAQQISFRRPNEPLRPRIAASGDPDVLHLVWDSKHSEAPTLRWGLERGIFENYASATAAKLRREQLFAPPATSAGWLELGERHTASFVGMLKYPGRRVYYIFGDAATEDWSGERVLIVPHGPGRHLGETRPATIAVFGDSSRAGDDEAFSMQGYGRASARTLEAVTRDVALGGVDAVLHLGDLSYASGYMGVWGAFLDDVADLASSVPYLSVLGNHEATTPNCSSSYFHNNTSGGEAGVVSSFLLPMPGPATAAQAWWSYDIGLMHVIGLNTEDDFAKGSPQFEWLRADLAAVDRRLTPWVIVAGHRPMYVDSYYASREDSVVVVMDKMIANLDPLFREHRVNAAFWGHHHSYQRHAAVYNKRLVQHSETVQLKVTSAAPTSAGDSPGDRTVFFADSSSGSTGPASSSSSRINSSPAPSTTQRTALYRDPQGTVHWIVGTGGADFTCDDENETPDLPFPHGDPSQRWYAWSEAFFYKHGHALATAVNRTHFSVTWKDSLDGKVKDAAMIIQNDPASPDARRWGQKEENSGDFKILGSEGDVIGVVIAFVASAALSAVIVFTLNVKQK